jgi:hypothetical protein
MQSWNLRLKDSLSSPRETGEDIGRLLRTSWREIPEVPVGLATAAKINSLLLDTGCGALAWWRLRGAPLETIGSVEPLRQAFRVHALEAARRKRDLEIALCAFNAAGLEPILFKGWTVTQFYAHPALRPFGDFDILVDESETAAAQRVIAALPQSIGSSVDLDVRVLSRFLPDRSFIELASRTSRANVGAGRFRLLAAEDHLRLICLHQLDHGAWRPLWLCDVAAFVERLPQSFHWDLCLKGNPNLSDGVVALVALAKDLLSARLPLGTPNRQAPPWFRNAVLRGWAGGHRNPPDSLRALNRLGWKRAVAAIGARWPDPITATLHLRAPFRGVPRQFLQVVELGRRAILFLRSTSRKQKTQTLSAVSADSQGAVL